MSRRDNAAVFPLHPGKEEHKRERKWGLCAFNEIVFCIQRGFQLLWGRWKALLATLKCLVLPAFGSMRGARTKYTTVQCKLSGKKLIQHRAIRTTGKQGGVDGLPCRSALSFLLEESCSRWRSGTRAAQRKVRGQQVSEGSNNLEKLLFQCGREWTGSSCKQGACTFGRFSPLVAGSSSVLRAGRGGACGHLRAVTTAHPPSALLSREPSCFCAAFRVARNQVSQKGVPLPESLRNSLLDQLVHPTRVIASLKYLVC